MTQAGIKKAYLTAAAVSAAITAVVLLYAVAVEILRAKGYAVPLRPPAAYAVKYALYIAGLSPLLVLKSAAGRFGGEQPSPELTLRYLTAFAILRAAACEVPALAGLLLFLLAGCRADFYVLAVFSLGLEIYNFPKLAAWEDRLRGDFGSS
jgi:hypothetical protein